MTLGSTTQSLSALYDVAMLDLDGVVYVGQHAVPGAAKALEIARANGMRLAYITNNASRTPHEVADHLRVVGRLMGTAEPPLLREPEPPGEHEDGDDRDDALAVCDNGDQLRSEELKDCGCSR